MSSTIKQSLDAYFKEHNLGEQGGLNEKWGKIKVGPIYIPIPNTEARKKALVFHDIHHVVTGYSGNWDGEVSISAWEISSGCGKYYAAWALDLWGMAVGLFLYPRLVYKAFIRGRRTKNLYHNTIAQQDALNMTADELRPKLLLDKSHDAPASGKELLAFAGWAFVSLMATFIPFVLPYILLLYWIF